MVTGFYAGVLTLIYIVLSFVVVRQRFRHKIGLGDNGNPEVMRAVRVHANFAEYVPLALLLMLLCEYVTAQTWMIHAMGLALVVARAEHAYGVSHSSGKSVGRFVGVVLTMTVLLSASVFLIIRYVTA